MEVIENGCCGLDEKVQRTYNAILHDDKPYFAPTIPK